MERKEARSSILKPKKPRSAFADVDFTVLEPTTEVDPKQLQFARKVRFSSNFVKEFRTEENNTIWDSTYEEIISKSEDSAQSVNKTASTTNNEITVNKTSLIVPDSHDKLNDIFENASASANDSMFSAFDNISMQNDDIFNKSVFGNPVCDADSILGKIETGGLQVQNMSQQIDKNNMDDSIRNITLIETNDIDVTQPSIFKDVNSMIFNSTLNVNQNNLVNINENDGRKTVLFGSGVNKPINNKQSSRVTNLEDDNSLKCSTKIIEDKNAGGNRKTMLFEDNNMEITQTIPLKNTTSRKTIHFNAGCNDGDMKFTQQLPAKIIECQISGSNRKSVRFEDNNMEIIQQIPLKNTTSRKTIYFNPSCEDGNMELTQPVPANIIESKTMLFDDNNMESTQGIPLKSTASRKTIHFNAGCEDGDMEFTQQLPTKIIEGKIAGGNRKTMLFEDNNMEITQKNVLKSNANRKTIHFNTECEEGNMEFTQQLPAKIIEDQIVGGNRKTMLFKDNDMELTQKLPLKSNASRKTIHFNAGCEDGDMEFTQQIPAKIIEDQIVGGNRKTMLFKDNDMEITQKLPLKSNTSRKTIHFNAGCEDGDMELTQQLPARIIEGKIPVDNIKSSLFQDNHMGTGQKIPLMSTENRKTIHFNAGCEEGDMEFTQQLPAKIIEGQIVADDRKTVLFKDTNMEITQNNPLKSTASRKTIHFNAGCEDGDMELTQKLPARIIEGKITGDNIKSMLFKDNNMGTGQKIPLMSTDNRKTIHFNAGCEEGDMEFTQQLPAKIIEGQIVAGDRKTVLFKDTNMEITQKNPFKSTSTRKTIHFNAGCEDGDMEFTQPLPAKIIEGKIAGDHIKTMVFQDNNIEIAQKIPWKSTENRKTIHFNVECEEGNMEFTKQLPAKIIEGQIVGGNRKTMLFEDNNMEITQEIPLKSTASRKTIHFNAGCEEGDMEFTQQLPAKIIEGQIVGANRKTMLFKDNNMEITQEIPLKSTASRKTIHFNAGCEEGDMEFTQQLPAKIIEGQIVGANRKTMLFNDNNMEITQEIPLKSTASRKTIHFNAGCEEGDMEFTQQLPAKIIEGQIVGANRKTMLFKDNNMEITQDISLKSTASRKTIHFNAGCEEGDMEFTQQLPAKIIEGQIVGANRKTMLFKDNNMEITQEIPLKSTASRKTIHFTAGCEDGDMELTEQRPAKIIEDKLTDGNRKTILFDDNNMKFTKQIPLESSKTFHIYTEGEAGDMGNKKVEKNPNSFKIYEDESLIVSDKTNNDKSQKHVCPEEQKIIFNEGMKMTQPPTSVKPIVNPKITNMDNSQDIVFKLGCDNNIELSHQTDANDILRCTDVNSDTKRCSVLNSNQTNLYTPSYNDDIGISSAINNLSNPNTILSVASCNEKATTRDDIDMPQAVGTKQTSLIAAKNPEDFEINCNQPTDRSLFRHDHTNNIPYDFSNKTYVDDTISGKGYFKFYNDDQDNTLKPLVENVPRNKRYTMLLRDDDDLDMTNKVPERNLLDSNSSSDKQENLTSRSMFNDTQVNIWSRCVGDDSITYSLSEGIKDYAEITSSARGANKINSIEIRNRISVDENDEISSSRNLGNTLQGLQGIKDSISISEGIKDTNFISEGIKDTNSISEVIKDYEETDSPIRITGASVDENAEISSSRILTNTIQGVNERESRNHNLDNNSKIDDINTAACNKSIKQKDGMEKTFEPFFVKNKETGNVSCVSVGNVHTRIRLDLEPTDTIIDNSLINMQLSSKNNLFEEEIADRIKVSKDNIEMEVDTLDSRRKRIIEKNDDLEINELCSVENNVAEDKATFPDEHLQSKRMRLRDTPLKNRNDKDISNLLNSLNTNISNQSSNNQGNVMHSANNVFLQSSKNISTVTTNIQSSNNEASMSTTNNVFHHSSKIINPLMTNMVKTSKNQISTSFQSSENINTTNSMDTSTDEMSTSLQSSKIINPSIPTDPQYSCNITNPSIRTINILNNSKNEIRKSPNINNPLNSNVKKPMEDTNMLKTSTENQANMPQAFSTSINAIRTSLMPSNIINPFNSNIVKPTEDANMLKTSLANEANMSQLVNKINNVNTMDQSTNIGFSIHSTNTDPSSMMELDNRIKKIDDNRDKSKQGIVNNKSSADGNMEFTPEKNCDNIVGGTNRKTNIFQAGCGEIMESVQQDSLMKRSNAGIMPSTKSEVNKNVSPMETNDGKFEIYHDSLIKSSNAAIVPSKKSEVNKNVSPMETNDGIFEIYQDSLIKRCNAGIVPSKKSEVNKNVSPMEINDGKFEIYQDSLIKRSNAGIVPSKKSEVNKNVSSMETNDGKFEIYQDKSFSSLSDQNSCGVIAKRDKSLKNVFQEKSEQKKRIIFNTRMGEDNMKITQSDAGVTSNIDDANKATVVFKPACGEGIQLMDAIDNSKSTNVISISHEKAITSSIINLKTPVYDKEMTNVLGMTQNSSTNENIVLKNHENATLLNNEKRKDMIFISDDDMEITTQTSSIGIARSRNTMVLGDEITEDCQTKSVETASLKSGLANTYLTNISRIRNRKLESDDTKAPTNLSTYINEINLASQKILSLNDGCDIKTVHQAKKTDDASLSSVTNESAAFISKQVKLFDHQLYEDSNDCADQNNSKLYDQDLNKENNYSNESNLSIEKSSKTVTNSKALSEIALLPINSEDNIVNTAYDSSRNLAKTNIPIFGTDKSMKRKETILFQSVRNEELGQRILEGGNLPTKVGSESIENTNIIRSHLESNGIIDNTQLPFGKKNTELNQVSRDNIQKNVDTLGACRKICNLFDKKNTEFNQGSSENIEDVDTLGPYRQIKSNDKQMKVGSLETNNLCSTEAISEENGDSNSPSPDQQSKRMRMRDTPLKRRSNNDISHLVNNLNMYMHSTNGSNQNPIKEQSNINSNQSNKQQSNVTSLANEFLQPSVTNMSKISSDVSYQCSMETTNVLNINSSTIKNPMMLSDFTNQNMSTNPQNMVKKSTIKNPIMSNSSTNQNMCINPQNMMKKSTDVSTIINPMVSNSSANQNMSINPQNMMKKSTHVSHQSHMETSKMLNNPVHSSIIRNPIETNNMLNSSTNQISTSLNPPNIIKPSIQSPNMINPTTETAITVNPSANDVNLPVQVIPNVIKTDSESSASIGPTNPIPSDEIITTKTDAARHKESIFRKLCETSKCFSSRFEIHKNYNSDNFLENIQRPTNVSIENIENVNTPNVSVYSSDETQHLLNYYNSNSDLSKVIAGEYDEAFSIYKKLPLGGSMSSFNIFNDFGETSYDKSKMSEVDANEFEKPQPFDIYVENDDVDNNRNIANNMNQIELPNDNIVCKYFDEAPKPISDKKHTQTILQESIGKMDMSLDEPHDLDIRKPDISINTTSNVQTKDIPKIVGKSVPSKTDNLFPQTVLQESIEIIDMSLVEPDGIDVVVQKPNISITTTSNVHNMDIPESVGKSIDEALPKTVTNKLVPQTILQESIETIDMSLVEPHGVDVVVRRPNISITTTSNVHNKDISESVGKSIDEALAKTVTDKLFPQTILHESIGIIDTSLVEPHGIDVVRKPDISITTTSNDHNKDIPAIVRKSNISKTTTSNVQNKDIPESVDKSIDEALPKTVTDKLCPQTVLQESIGIMNMSLEKPHDENLPITNISINTTGNSSNHSFRNLVDISRKGQLIQDEFLADQSMMIDDISGNDILESSTKTDISYPDFSTMSLQSLVEYGIKHCNMDYLRAYEGIVQPRERCTDTQQHKENILKYPQIVSDYNKAATSLYNLQKLQFDEMCRKGRVKSQAESVENSVENIEILEKKTLEEKIMQQANDFQDSYVIIADNKQTYTIKSLYKTIHVRVVVDDSDFGFVTDIDVKSAIDEESPPFSLFVNKLFMDKLSTEKMRSAIGGKYSIFTLLDYIHLNNQAFVKMSVEFDKLRLIKVVKMDPEFKIVYPVIDAKLRVSLRITVDFADMNCLNENAVSVEVRHGAVREKDIKSLVRNVTGFEFFTCFVANVDRFLEEERLKRDHRRM